MRYGIPYEVGTPVKISWADPKEQKKPTQGATGTVTKIYSPLTTGEPCYEVTFTNPIKHGLRKWTGIDIAHNNLEVIM